MERVDGSKPEAITFFTPPFTYIYVCKMLLDVIKCIYLPCIFRFISLTGSYTISHKTSNKVQSLYCLYINCYKMDMRATINFTIQLQFTILSSFFSELSL